MATLFRKQPEKPSTAVGERVYAIGDIHGRYDLFRDIVKKIIAHWEAGPCTFSKIRIVLLGDLIDRGPASAHCLEFAYELVKKSDVVLLRGNHEDLLLKSIEGHAVAQEIWLANGGLAFLSDYGIAPPQAGEDGFDFADRLSRAVPPHLVELLKQAQLTFKSGDYLFVHAGIRPGKSLKQQREEDLLFIRKEFTESTRKHGAVIVHGHTIVDRVEMHDNRIAVDTGAFASGRLSCICLEGRRRQILHT